MNGLGQEGPPLSVLLTATTSLLSSSDRAAACDQALQALASYDPFFADATISLCRLDLDEGVREVLASCGPQAHEPTREAVFLAGISNSATKLLFRLWEGKPLFIDDGQRLPGGVVDLLEWLLPAASEKPLLILPVLSRGSITGILYLERPDLAGCGGERLQMLRLFVNCLSLALAASNHHGEEKERDSVLRAALEAQEKERERISLGIHDGALQLLTAAFQHVRAAQDSLCQDEEASRSALAKASGLIRETTHELRALMEHLLPAALDHFGLIAAIESEVEKLRQEGWQAELVADAIQMPKSRETSLYRIIHEALTNVRKHAGSCPVRVSLETRGPELWVEVRDWGLGFDLSALAQQDTPPGFGLLSMQRRAELLGGSCEVESRPGAGTRVCVYVPVRRRGDWALWNP